MEFGTKLRYSSLYWRQSRAVVPIFLLVLVLTSVEISDVGSVQVAVDRLWSGLELLYLGITKSLLPGYVDLQ